LSYYKVNIDYFTSKPEAEWGGKGLCLRGLFHRCKNKRKARAFLCLRNNKFL